MSKKEELEKFLHGELDNIYCYNCRKGDDCDDDECHRKNMGWQASQGLIDRIVEIAMRKE